MKKLMLSVLVSMVVTLAWANPKSKAPLAHSVTPTSSKVTVAYPGYSTNEWVVSGTGSINTIVSVGTDRFYLHLSAGVYWTNAPTHIDGDATNGTATLRYIHRDTAGITFANDSTNVLYMSYGKDAVLNKGWRLNANGGTLSFGPEYSGSFTVIGPAGTTNTLCIQPL